MAKQHRDILAKLDPLAITRYQITEADIRTIEQYLKIIQRGFVPGSTWHNIVTLSGVYATCIVIHELVEIRALRNLGIDPLKLKTTSLREAVVANIDVHNQATYNEHLYLQEVIFNLTGQRFEIGTLIVAHRGQEGDFELLLESAIGRVILEPDRVEEAEAIITGLM